MTRAVDAEVCVIGGGAGGRGLRVATGAPRPRRRPDRAERVSAPARRRSYGAVNLDRPRRAGNPRRRRASRLRARRAIDAAMGGRRRGLVAAPGSFRVDGRPRTLRYDSRRQGQESRRAHCSAGEGKDAARAPRRMDRSRRKRGRRVVRRGAVSRRCRGPLLQHPPDGAAHRTLDGGPFRQLAGYSARTRSQPHRGGGALLVLGRAATRRRVFAAAWFSSIPANAAAVAVAKSRPAIGSGWRNPNSCASACAAPWRAEFGSTTPRRIRVPFA